MRPKGRRWIWRERLKRGSPSIWLERRETRAHRKALMSSSDLAEIADRVGDGSEAALSRAFKRRLGVSPTPYRRGDHVWQDAS
jgi:AraC-like DNA-binding protein